MKLFIQNKRFSLLFSTVVLVPGISGALGSPFNAKCVFQIIHHIVSVLPQENVCCKEMPALEQDNLSEITFDLCFCPLPKRKRRAALVFLGKRIPSKRKGGEGWGIGKFKKLMI